jgi:hypothetical protein
MIFLQQNTGKTKFLLLNLILLATNSLIKKRERLNDARDGYFSFVDEFQAVSMLMK